VTRIFAIAGLLLVASCGQQNESAAPQPKNEAAAAPSPAAQVPPLEGNWKVASLGGVPDAASVGMTASFGNGSATIARGCLKRAWTYTQKRNIVAFTSSPGGSSNCGSAPGGAEEAAYAALGEANIVVFSKEGREASLSGTGGTLTLERR